ncbi:hypothetical protein J4204_04950 [Candidatus Woesearchaeota archaeon]|nr:hypothetical protein [Candidatus Woesearchaeota archaeon]
MQEVMVPCKKCGNKVPSSSLKLDLDEKKMICPDCIKNKHVHKEIEKDVFHKEDIKESPEAQKTKIAHKCTSCGYGFKIDIDAKTPRNCPYCNARVMMF